MSLRGQGYKNANLPMERRIQELLSRMTLEEKVAQLRTGHANAHTLTDDIFDNPVRMDSIYGHVLGMINPAFDATKEQVINRRNRLQLYLTAKTRR
ncbi:MAG: hypothetical protein DI539_27485 [Flavobacterium psychrophilum]|nr:MAG: hypothetical protein DI539_27485 [Flavobacterium psychrophilum]